MAELFWKQGHAERAIEIYTKIVAEHPGDEQAARRLRELRSHGNAQGAGMSFRERLQGIVDTVPGAVGCILMGYDGIAIDMYQREAGVDIAVLSIECTAALMPLRNSPDGISGVGKVDELTIRGEIHTTILKPVTDEYLLAVVVKSDGLVSKARHKMRVALPLLRSEFA